VASLFGSWGLGIAAVAVACGGRTALEDGPGSSPDDDGAGGDAGIGGGGAGLSNYDPDVECPNLGCGTDEACPPAILTAGRELAWATIDGGDLYFATNDPDAENALIRVPVCGGGEQVLLERKRFAGEGVIAGDYLYIPVEEPTREVLRLPKTGGAPTVIHTHEANDPYLTRAISANNGYVMLSQYSFDGGLVLKEINPSGKAHALNENLPDQDWFLVTTVASGFLPNKPAFFTPPSGEGYAALIGAEFGVYRVRPFDALAGDPTFIEPFHLDVPAVGPLLVEGGNEADLTVYFSASPYDDQIHFKLEAGFLQPILPEADGMMLAIDGGQVFGSENDFYMGEQPEDLEYGGSIWQAAATDLYGERVFSTRFQNAFAVEVHGESVYVRTTRAVVRFPKSCYVGDERCTFHYED
jgi:hypothetical protein